MVPAGLLRAQELLVGRSGNQLVEIDISTCQTVPIATQPSGPTTSDTLAISETGVAYFSTKMGGLGETLYQWDILGGIQLPVGGGTGFGDVFGMAMSPTGELYATDGNTNQLIKINLSTGIGTPICSIPGQLQAIAFRGDGALFGVTVFSGGSVYQIDPATCLQTSIGTAGYGMITGIAFIGDTLYGIDISVNALIEIDTSTGLGTIVAGCDIVTGDFGDLDTLIPNFNQAPVADCGQERAVVFDTITLDGSGSSDPEGLPLSYEWTLQHEDGTTITFYESNPVIENLEPGFIDVTLKVFDDQNASGTDTMLIAAAGSCFCTASTMHIQSIVAGTAPASKNLKYGRVTVTIFDDCGNPVSGASITGTFTFPDFSETPNPVTTNNEGVAVILTTAEIKKPSYTFCVDGVVKGTLAYEPNDNVETCETK